MFRLPKDREMDISTLDYFLGLHAQEVAKRYQPLMDAYLGKHDILDTNKHKPKDAWKPDNRIAVNFPKYIVDTFNGFFIGNPCKITANKEDVAERVDFLGKYSDQSNHDAELSKLCSIFGKGYEMYYTDDEAQPCFIKLSPIDAFMIYDDSILERPLFFVRRYKDWEGNEYGSISNRYGVRHFAIAGGTRWTDEWTAHQFCDVPATEYVENDERQGLYETALSMINSYNKALSEKANDCDYFADAYLKVLGAELNKEGVQNIRDNRIINIYGEFGDSPNGIVAEFMSKPSNDAGQETLLNRLERLIFQMCMVANISDEHFGTASGIALEYKVLAMHNLVKMKTRKFESGMNRRYKLLFSHPMAKVAADAWVGLDYQFTPNLPANRLEEAEIAAKMEGITSHETQLKVLSVVDNVKDEMARIEEENAPAEETAVDRAMFGGKPFGETDKENTDTDETDTEDDAE